MAVVYTLLFMAVCLYSTDAYPWDNTCRSNMFPADISVFCANNPNAKVPYLDDCSAYYDCGFTFADVPRYYEQHMRTCPYPELFDPSSETCKPYKEVKCCDRIEPTAPCDYRQHKCKYAHCQPCEFNRPSCYGMSDGLHEVRDRPSLFFECTDGRTFTPTGNGAQPVDGTVFATYI